jgi:hypothetical protein
MQQNFSQLFPSFPDHSRVWIYQADRQLDGTELAFVKDGLDAFIADWAAHGKGLQAQGEVVYDRVLILCVNETSVHASGCSIDSSVRFVKVLGSELGVDFFDRLHLNLLTGDGIERIHLSELTKFPTALLIDPMVANLGQLRESGIVSVKDSVLYQQLS